jgi:predicted metal-dependent peptidase
MPGDDIETKLAAARTRLILDKPFLGALVLRLPMQAGDPKWCKTTGTDAKTFYYNRAYIDELSLEQTQFVLAHEAMHCALSHFSRRQHRLKHRWDLACDFAVNPILVDDGLKPPPDALYMRDFAGMTAEEIYHQIGDLEDQEPMDQHLYDEEDKEKQEQQQDTDSGKGDQPDNQKNEQQGDETSGKEGQSGSASEAELDENLGGASQPPPLNDMESDALSVQWQQRLAGAAQQAMQAGKLSGAMERLVDHLLQPQLPWRMLLARYMTAVARDDFSFARPSRREGNAILPSLRSTQVELTVAIDTSGSISEEELEEFITEIDAIKGQMRARVTLLACDDKLDERGPWVYEAWETFSLPDDIQGGGGTNFNPVFDYIKQQGREPDLLLYFSDAEGEFPEAEVHFDVIWLVKGKATVPWGQRIQLN